MKIKKIIAFTILSLLLYGMTLLLFSFVEGMSIYLSTLCFLGSIGFTGTIAWSINTLATGEEV